MLSTPQLSIIIPHYNNYSIVNNCLNSLKKITYESYEIIVIDNHSSDNSYQLLKENHEYINLVQTTNNLGYAGGCNFGAKFAKGEYLLFLNNDTIHEPNFIEPLIEMLNSNDNISCVQPKIKNYDKKKYFDYAGASGGFIDYLVFPFCRGRIFNKTEKDNNQYNQNMKVFWTSGTAFITRKLFFNKINGFDEKLFSHMEEIDYCWKSYLMGYESWVVPNSVIYHKGGQTLKYDSPYKTYLNHRNSIILLLTNFQINRSILSFLIRFILEIISSVYDLFRLRPLHFIAHYKTFFFLIFNLNYLIKRRKFINQIRKIKDKGIFSQGIILNNSIVKLYFLFNKFFFTQVKNLLITKHPRL